MRMLKLTSLADVFGQVLNHSEVGPVLTFAPKGGKSALAAFGAKASLDHQIQGQM